MAIGERIHFFRNMRGMTQKYTEMSWTVVGLPGEVRRCASCSV